MLPGPRCGAQGGMLSQAGGQATAMHTCAVMCNCNANFLGRQTHGEFHVITAKEGRSSNTRPSFPRHVLLVPRTALSRLSSQAHPLPRRVFQQQCPAPVYPSRALL